MNELEIYFLYAGAALAGVMALFCALSGALKIKPKVSKLVLIIGWSLTSLSIIAGIVLSYLKESFCCGRQYTQIFQTPMNKVRDPDAPRVENVRRLARKARNDRYTQNQYARFGRRNNYASQRYQYAY